MPGFWDMLFGLDTTKLKLYRWLFLAGVILSGTAAFLVTSNSEIQITAGFLLFLGALILYPIFVASQELMWRKNEFIKEKFSVAKLFWANVTGTSLLGIVFVVTEVVIFTTISGTILATNAEVSALLHESRLLYVVIGSLGQKDIAPLIAIFVLLTFLFQAVATVFVHMIGDSMLNTFDLKINRTGKIIYYAILWVIFNILISTIYRTIAVVLNNYIVSIAIYYWIFSFVVIGLMVLLALPTIKLLKKFIASRTIIEESN